MRSELAGGERPNRITILGTFFACYALAIATVSRKTVSGKQITILLHIECSCVAPAHCQPLTARCHLITLSARASTLGGIVTPISFAVLRFTTNVNLVGCSMGRLAGLAPTDGSGSLTPSRRSVFGWQSLAGPRTLIANIDFAKEEDSLWHSLSPRKSSTSNSFPGVERLDKAKQLSTLMHGRSASFAALPSHFRYQCRETQELHG
jgi:hypothetical protein